MSKNDKYVVAITILSILFIISVMVVIICVKIIDDLNGVIDMHKNTINVCRIDLEHTQIENDDLRENCFKED